MALAKDGEKLFYLARFEKGYDLWMTETADAATPSSSPSSAPSADGHGAVGRRQGPVRLRRRQGHEDRPRERQVRAGGHRRRDGPRRRPPRRPTCSTTCGGR
ncbi:MAG: hypothetical protein MZU91_11120 [Desulfosudis oleivorans]|nr:hypothetical protein [Desulfosudis oleivorans]